MSTIGYSRRHVRVLGLARHLTREGTMPAVSHYLYRIQPTRSDMLSAGPTAEESAIVAEHFAYLKQLTEQGVVVLAGRTLNTDPSAFGTVILAPESEDAAR